MSVIVGLAVTGSLFATPAFAAPKRERGTAVQRDISVPGRAPTAGGTLADPVRRYAPPPVSWPGTGVAEVDPTNAPARQTAGAAAVPGRARAGSLPVAVGPAGTGKAGPSRVRVEVLDRASAERTHQAVLVRVAPVAGFGPVSFEIDYSGFAAAFGSDTARLGLVRLPECALTTPDRSECQGTVIPSVNTGTGRVTAEVQLADPAGARGLATSGSLLGVTTTGAGASGDFKATPLQASATWSSGGSAGDFTWAHPMRVPPGRGSAVPELGLTYSSQSVDGRMVASNNQPSWAGQGFNLSVGGSIERRYVPCSEDMASGASNTVKTGDQCWRTDNATLSLGDSGGELVFDDTSKTWHTRNDVGAKVERLTGASNGDNDGEYWKVTTTDGTQFYFGLNRLPGWSSGRTETGSTFTVPVFGNHTDEPCRGSSYDASWCQQAWRWNLDHVVDRNGNTMSLYYGQEKNYYGRNIDPNKGTEYVRGGYLTKVEYGQRDGDAYTQPVGKVVFDVADRCPAGAACDPAVPANRANWADTPWNEWCKSGESCVNRLAPTFWTRYRLARVLTQVSDGAGGFRDVDSWTLRHSYPRADSSSNAGLWLDGITHTGLVGGSLALPELTFRGEFRENRVDTATDAISAMNWMRITGVVSETGGVLTVDYAPQECAAGSLPAPESNTKRCYPVKWTPPGLPERVDWFHKYVVASISESDLSTGVVPVQTRYEYAGGGAWHYDDADGLTPAEKKTWSQWRGYAEVRTRKGNASIGTSEPVSLNVGRYLRGMHGDKQPAGTRTVQYQDSKGVLRNDDNELAGLVRESVTYLGDTTTEVSGARTDYWVSPVTATQTRSWATTHARTVAPEAVQNRTSVGAGARHTRVEKSYGTFGVLTSTNELGEVTAAGVNTDTTDDTCTRNWYAAGPRNQVALPTRVQTVSVACAVGSPTPAQVLSDNRTFYDQFTGPNDHGTVGAIGMITRTERLKGWNGQTPDYQTLGTATYDPYGRETATTDIRGQLTTTAYTPATNAPTVKTVSTNPLSFVSTIDYKPEWGLELAVVDPNGKRGEVTYDELGRVSKVWQPGRSRAAYPTAPSVEYSYLVRTSGPAVVTTRALRADGGYNTSHELFDGLLRKRQSQAPSPSKLGGRVVVDTFYDSQGRVSKQSNQYWNSGPVGQDILPVLASDVPGSTHTGFDGAGRIVTSVFKANDVEQWKTVTSYGGDRTHVVPPAGGTATTTIADVWGRTTELRQYRDRAQAGSANPAHYDATAYEYSHRGQVKKVTDADGNSWTHEYDELGRAFRTVDPDRGTTTTTFDDYDQVRSSMDERGQKIFLEYDVLGRKKNQRKDSATGQILTSWAYDSLAKGQLDSSTRYVVSDGQTHAYTTRVTATDDAYRPLTKEVVIPPKEGALAGTYAFSATYNPDGSPKTTTLPAAGGLSAETLTLGYNTLGLPNSLTGKNNFGYVTGLEYSAFAEPYWLMRGSNKYLDTFAYYDTATRRQTRTLTERQTSPITPSDVRAAYDPAGNVTSVRDVQDLAAGKADTQCYEYDHLKRLTAAWTPGNGDCAVANRTVAALGGPAAYWLAWTFDATGNRRTQTGKAAAGDTVTTSQYPAVGGRRHTLQSAATTGPGGLNTSETYEYDLTGNTTKRVDAAGTQTLEWDAEGHLEKLTDRNGKATTFVYDADGNRLIRRDPAGSTAYVGGGMELRQPVGSTTVTCVRYYAFAAMPIAVRTNDGKLSWLSNDRHGSARLSLDEVTQAVQRTRTDPFGNQRGTAPAAWPGDKGFVGGTRDNTGYTHLGAREYDPTTGRFLSRDQIVDAKDPQQMNGYAYANNSPVSSSDPTGKRTVVDGDDGGGVPVPVAPTVSHQKLRDLLNAMYSRPNAGRVFQDGKLSSAIVEEYHSGTPVKDKPGMEPEFHLKKGVDTLGGLTELLQENQNLIDKGQQPILTPEEVDIAKKHTKELWNAINVDDTAGGVTEHYTVRKPGQFKEMQGTMQKVDQRRSVADITGAKWEPVFFGKNQKMVVKQTGGSVTKGFARGLLVLDVVTFGLAVAQFGPQGALDNYFNGLMSMTAAPPGCMFENGRYVCYYYGPTA